MTLHPDIERLAAAPVAGLGSQLPGDHATGMGSVRLLVIGIHPGIAKFWVGEADELTGVGGVGEHLLVTGHAGVEHHFANHGSTAAEGLSRQNGAVSKNEMCRSGCGRRHQCGEPAWFRTSFSIPTGQGFPQGDEPLPGKTRIQNADRFGSRLTEIGFEAG